ncbi:MAG: tetratricopeptide repeat protein [Burkholderiales bacterium]|nr:tetratricopeptide repeat protein [Burkholderiales bacterium]
MRHVALRTPGQQDVRWRALAITVFAIAAGGLVIAAVSDGSVFARRAATTTPASAVGQMGATSGTRQEIHSRFQQGVVMLHARQHNHAMTAFHRVLELDPTMPEAHVNMGFALIGLERYGAARDFFESAIALRKNQANAYYGLAVALDGLGDRPAAIGAMRSYVHLSRAGDPYQRKAQAALWEWEEIQEKQGAKTDRTLIR